MESLNVEEVSRYDLGVIRIFLVIEIIEKIFRVPHKRYPMGQVTTPFHFTSYCNILDHVIFTERF